MPEYLTVIAKMKAKKGKEEELKKMLLGLLEPTRAESGCIQYDCHESLEDPGLFIFYENWKGERSMADHIQSPHIRKAFARVPELLDGKLELYRLKKIN